MSNLTKYKIFIGDDKKNTLFGVTFSFNPKYSNMTAVGSKQIPLNCTTFRCWTCLFLPKQCRQRHSQCSSPRKQNRKYPCQSHPCPPDHSSRRKRDPWPNMFKLVFSLNCREFERHYCITADSINGANIPPKRICDPVDL